MGPLSQDYYNICTQGSLWFTWLVVKRHTNEKHLVTETVCVTTLISKLSVYSENCLQCLLPKVREALSMQICAKKKRNGPPSANQAFLQPTTVAAMCTAIHDPCLNPFTSPYCLCRTYLHSALLQGMLKSADSFYWFKS